MISLRPLLQSIGALVFTSLLVLAVSRITRSMKAPRQEALARLAQ